MKSAKKMMVGVVLAITLLGNCFAVSAATNSCEHCTVSVYSKELTHREFLYSHTEQHGQ